MIAVALFRPIFTGTLWNSTEKAISKVSVSSMTLSHIIGILSDLLSSPGSNVTFNVLEIKSTPDPAKKSIIE